MIKSRQLVDQYLTGKTSKELFDLLEEVLPTKTSVGQDIVRELSARGINCSSKPNRAADNIINIMLEEKSFAVDAIIEIYQTAYPEYRILPVVEKMSSDKATQALMLAVQEFISVTPNVTASMVVDQFPDLTNYSDNEEISKWIDLVKSGSTIV